MPRAAARMAVLSKLRSDITAQAPLRAPTALRMKAKLAPGPQLRSKRPCPASRLTLQILQAFAPSSSPLPRIPPPHVPSGQISYRSPLTVKLSLTRSFPCTRPPSPGQQTKTHSLTLVHINKALLELSLADSSKHHL